VGVAPMTLARPVDQLAHEHPHHRSHADIVLSPTPPPKAPVQPPWQPARARATVAMSPQPMAAAPTPPPPAPTAIIPVVPTVDARARPVPQKPAPTPKQSDLLAYIRDDER